MGKNENIENLEMELEVSEESKNKDDDELKKDIIARILAEKARLEALANDPEALLAYVNNVKKSEREKQLEQEYAGVNIDVNKLIVRKVVLVKKGDKATKTAKIYATFDFEGLGMKELLSLATCALTIKYQARLRAQASSNEELYQVYNGTMQTINAKKFMADNAQK